LKKVAIWCAFFAFFLSFGTLFCYAEEGEQSAFPGEVEAAQVEGEYRAFLDAIPPEVAELLPEGFFSERFAERADAIEEISAPAAVLSALGRVTGITLSDALSLLARICGILVLSAVFRLASASEEGEGAAKALSFFATVSLVLMIFATQTPQFDKIFSYFSALRALAVALLPMMGALYAMGGNVGTALANHGVMTGFLSLLETAISSSVMPVAGLCLALSLIDALSGKVDLRSLSALIKRTYTWTFSLLMLLLCGVLGVQSTLSKGADTLALRTARFAAGSFLPVVGGSIGEALRTVSGSVQFLRAVAGTGAVVVLFLAFLPLFISLLLTRTAFLLSGSAAKLLGCVGEEKVLSELASVYGYFLAVTASLFVMLVFSLTLFANCAVAG
jgi:stage III sporulation protein AE